MSGGRPTAPEERGVPKRPRGPQGGGSLWQRLAEAQDAALAAEDFARSHGAEGSGRVQAPVIRAQAQQSGRQSGRHSGRIVLTVRSVRVAASIVAVAAVAAALFVLIPRRPATLRVQVGASAHEAMAPVPGLVADARSNLPLRFSDGSAVTFRAGSEGRLASLTGSGGDIVLERGALEAHIIHAAGTAWVVQAGPYRVRVTGTRFAVQWRGDRLDVALYEGSVIVDGSVLGAGVPLTAGRRLTVASGVVRIEPFRTERPLAGGSADVTRAAGRGEPERGVADDFGFGESGGIGDGDRSGRSPNGPSATGTESAPGAAVTEARARATAHEATAGSGAASDVDLTRRGTRSSGATETLALAEVPRANDPLARLGADPDAEAALEATDRASSERSTGGAPHPRRHRHHQHARELRAGARAADETWLALAEDRQYPEALAAAKPLGWSNLCRRLEAHRLLTLADVARYSGARDLARRAFEALARRFRHDRLAGDAAFSLGRMAFEAGRPAEAARWFRRYGNDWPNGPLADEAAGRLVESAIRVQDAEAARAAAHAYLARAPHGPQASLARGVLADSLDGAP